DNVVQFGEGLDGAIETKTVDRREAHRLFVVVQETIVQRGASCGNLHATKRPDHVSVELRFLLRARRGAERQKAFECLRFCLSALSQLRDSAIAHDKARIAEQPIRASLSRLIPALVPPTLQPA